AGALPVHRRRARQGPAHRRGPGQGPYDEGAAGEGGLRPPVQGSAEAGRDLDGLQSVLPREPAAQHRRKDRRHGARHPRRGLRPARPRRRVEVRLRGALLGAGNIALRGHAPRWMGDPGLVQDVEIVAVADLSSANRAAASKLFPGARTYDNAEALLAEERLDFCDICTPPFTHRPLVEAAAARGVSVLCEKPIATSVEDAEAIAKSVRDAGIVFAPCHQYHHSPQWQTVARLLPRIGRIHLVEYEVHRTEANPGNPNWEPSWRTKRDLAGGGILFDHGAHIFYQLRSVLGEPASVQATVRKLHHSQYGVEDSAFVVLDYGDR